MAELPPRRALRRSAWAKLGPLHAHACTCQRKSLLNPIAVMPLLMSGTSAHGRPAPDSAMLLHVLSQLFTPQQRLKMSCYTIVIVSGDAADLRLMLLGSAACSEPGCGLWS